MFARLGKGRKVYDTQQNVIFHFTGKAEKNDWNH